MTAGGENPLTAEARAEALASLAESLLRNGTAGPAIIILVRVENSRRCQPPLEPEEIERIVVEALRRDRGDGAWSGPPQRDREPHPTRSPATTPSPVVDDGQAERMERAAEAPESAARRNPRPAERMRERVSATSNSGKADIGSAGGRRQSEAVAICANCGDDFPRTRPWSRFCTKWCRMAFHRQLRLSVGEK